MTTVKQSHKDREAGGARRIENFILEKWNYNLEKSKHRLIEYKHRDRKIVNDIFFPPSLVFMTIMLHSSDGERL